jgi:hypothetical protein
VSIGIFIKTIDISYPENFVPFYLVLLYLIIDRDVYQRKKLEKLPYFFLIVPVLFLERGEPCNGKTFKLIGYNSTT